MSDTDRFLLQFPVDVDQSESKEVILLRRDLNFSSITSHVPNGLVFVGLVDSDGFDLGELEESDLQDLDEGTYKVMCNVVESNISADISPQDINRAYFSTLACVPSKAGALRSDEILKSLHSSLNAGDHDLVASALANVHSGDASWNYLLSLSVDSVVVAINCDMYKDSFFEFDKPVQFASNAGQGNGDIHPIAHKFASLLPFNTLLSMCTSNTEPFEWKSVQKLADATATRKRLIFTGRSVSGMVAHVAALLAREMSTTQSLGVDVVAVTFNTPSTFSQGISNALLQTGISSRHVTYCRESDLLLKLFQVAFDAQMAKVIAQDSVFNIATITFAIKKLLNSASARDHSAAKKDIQLVYDRAVDMIATHAQAIHTHKFIPTGTFIFFKSHQIGPKKTVKAYKLTDAFSIQDKIDAIPLKFEKVSGHKRLKRAILDSEVQFEHVRKPCELKNIAEALCPVVNQCQIIITPGKPKSSTASRVDVTLMGSFLENVIQRGHHSGVGIAHVGSRRATDPSKSPILFRDLKTIEVSTASAVVVLTTGPHEAKLMLTDTVYRAEGEMNVYNDFGASNNFIPSQYHTLDHKDASKLQMFSSFNDDLLITTFLRSMMLLYSAPDLYFSSGGDDTHPVIVSQLPEPLRLLFEVEKLILETPDSELQQIVLDYCNTPEHLPYATSKARRVIDKIVSTLMSPLKLQYESKFKNIVSKVVGGLGVASGGIITIVGAVLALPGILLALLPIIGIALSAESASVGTTAGCTIAAIPGVILSLPGLGVGAAGVWLVSRSLQATRDKPSMQYAQILKVLLMFLGADLNTVLDEIPSLENAIVKQFNKLKKQYDANNPLELWQVDDEFLHQLLGAVKVIVAEKDKQREISVYTQVFQNVTTQQKVRNWMRASARIHRIRGLVENHLVVGFIGVHNAGKSTWINRLFNLGVMADGVNRTERAELFPLHFASANANLRETWKKANPSSVQLAVVDYPGTTDEREMIAQLAEKLANVTTLFVCVFRFGHIAKPEKDVIDTVKKHARDFFVLINQCDIASDLHVREHEYRANYAGVLEIDSSLIHFVSSLDEARVAYVRHQIWSHLQILVHEPEDQIELAMQLLDTETRASIIQGMPNEDVASYLTLKVLQPFYLGKTEGSEESLFQMTDLYNNLPLSTRFQPVMKLPTTPFKEYGTAYSSNMDFLSRVALFRKHVRGPGLMATFTVTPVPIENSKAPFEELCTALLEMEPTELSNGLKVNLVDDAAIDVGGVSRAIFVAVARQFQENQVAQVKSYDQKPNSQTVSVFFNPVEDTHTASVLRGIGRMIGICILQELNFPANFALVLFKLILGQPISFKDYEAFDPSYARSIQQICEMDPEQVDCLEQYFVITETHGPEQTPVDVDLVVDGKEKQVTGSNLVHYLRTVIHHRLCKHLPLESFVLGVSDVIPRNKLCLFSPQMLQLLVNGHSSYSVDDLRQHCDTIASPSSQVMEWLWECIGEMTDHDRALFLAFVTGSVVLPAAGFGGLSPPITISHGMSTLPKSSTCFNKLSLAEYDSKEQLRESLLFAIRNVDSLDFGNA